MNHQNIELKYEIIDAILVRMINFCFINVTSAHHRRKSNDSQEFLVNQTEYFGIIQQFFLNTGPYPIVT